MNKIFWGRCQKTESFEKHLFEEFLGQSNENLRRICNYENDFPKHIVKAEFFSPQFLEHLYDIAKTLKKLYRGNPAY